MITNEQIELLKLTIAQTIKPEQIVIFGSYSKGLQTEDSDLDLLVIVKDSTENRLQRTRTLRKSLWGIVAAPKDIMVYTEKEVNFWKDIEFSFISNILKEGRVIYEKSDD